MEIPISCKNGGRRKTGSFKGKWAEKWNSLHRANIWNPSSPETIRFYIDKGVPVNAQDIYGMTPLHYAIRAENGDMAMVLLEAGADPNIETYADQGIPLAMIGGILDRLDVLKAMLDKGVDVHHPVKNANMSLLDFMKTYFSDDQSLKPVIALMEQYAWCIIGEDSSPVKSSSI